MNFLNNSPAYTTAAIIVPAYRFSITIAVTASDKRSMLMMKIIVRDLNLFCKTNGQNNFYEENSSTTADSRVVFHNGKVAHLIRHVVVSPDTGRKITA